MNRKSPTGFVVFGDAVDGARRPDPIAPEQLDNLARRAAAFADGMNFRLLYDHPRGLLSIGYRPADSEGPGRHDPAYYDLLASEARLASFIAIAKGDIPETHWFRLGRPVTSIKGVPTLLSWGATMFEYLMPLLVMRTYPETLLDETCRMAVRRQSSTAKNVTCRGACPNAPTTSWTGTAHISTGRLACRVSACGGASATTS